MSALLEVANLRKSYGDRVVLDDVDLTVETGDVVCLIGSSGSGKSTLLRCLNLLEVIDDGVISFEGREVSDPRVDRRAVRGRMGMVFQAYNLFPHLSVLDNITLAPRKVHGLSRADAEERAHDLLGRFGLAEHARSHPDRLSGGQQQRVALVRALAPRPALLLLDVQQHDDEDDEHHDRAGVNDDLDGGDERGRERQVEAGQRHENEDQRDGAVKRITLHDE